ncbi:MAG: hypothetical protein ACYC23_12250 [Limisphaerales bacterium]
MLLKASLIVAVLASVMTLIVSQWPLADKIRVQTEELASTQSSLAQSQQDEAAAKEEARKFKGEAEKLSKDLAETSEKLETMTSRANTQQKRADQYEGDLFKTRGELTESQRELASWKALTIPVEQVRSRLAELTQANEALTVLNEEKKVMARRIAYLDDRLQNYEGGDQPPPDLPPGLKGKVVAVDAKWDFVVLDIGGNHGLVPRGELLVSREGKLVAKLRVTAVEADQSIANVLPGWKQAEIIEGDVVMH